MDKYPRITIAGLGGDTGKTLVSLGLIAHLRKLKYEVQAFKKGPDYIDASWLSYASGKPARNLDIYMMGKNTVKQSFLKHALHDGINIIESNRGIFDGENVDGEYSSAELAKLIDSPVILVLDATKVTRTLAALVLGIKNFDKDLKIAGIIVNKIHGSRHKSIVTESIEKYTGIPVIGVIPKLKYNDILPSRDLGLVTPIENMYGIKMLDILGDEIAKNIDIKKILQIANSAGELESFIQTFVRKNGKSEVTIGYISDSAFTFYYPENLETLAESGAKLIPVSALTETELPYMDLLYIGGGFPETHLIKLSENISLLNSIRKACNKGLPVYAECGGLVYLSKSTRYKNKNYKLCGLLPLEIEFHDEPVGHGYCKVEVDTNNPFFPVGSIMQGHEFHYTSATPVSDEIKTVFKVEKGVGTMNGRDGIIINNIFASYFHFHAIGNMQWTKGMINAAKKYANSRKKKIELA